MKQPNSIRFITNDQLDRAKWDDCIIRSNGLIYGRCFYLDQMSQNWDGLVLNDYEAVMPLTWNRKWGFHYLYQPFFTAALGVFGSDTRQADAFLQAVPSRFSYWDIDLNEKNVVSNNDIPKRTCIWRTNYMLDMHSSYADISVSYKRLAKRMIKRATDAKIRIVRQVSPSQIVDLYKNEYRKKHPDISDAIYERLTACMKTAFEQGMAQTYIATGADHIPLAFYIVLKDDNYLYSVIGGSTEEGQKQGAFYLLTDAAIQDHCPSNRVFRFEGSDIKGIAFFNSQFGPQKIHYTHIIQNNLPFPVNLLKQLKK